MVREAIIYLWLLFGATSISSNRFSAKNEQYPAGSEKKIDKIETTWQKKVGRAMLVSWTHFTKRCRVCWTLFYNSKHGEQSLLVNKCCPLWNNSVVIMNFSQCYFLLVVLISWRYCIFHDAISCSWCMSYPAHVFPIYVFYA